MQAGHGPAATDCLERARLDLTIADADLPGLSGLDRLEFPTEALLARL